MARVFLTDMTRVRITGADAATFLQGQLTADIAAMPTATVQKALYCTPKGEALMMVYLTRTTEQNADVFYLYTADEGADKAIARLKMFVLRADVKMDMDDAPVYGVVNHGADAAADAKPAAGDITLFQGVRLTTTPPAHDAPESTDAFWHMAFQHGVFRLRGQATFAPWVAGRNESNAIHYEKGCFVGQEPIARMHHRGKQTKHAVCFLTTSLSADIGDKLACEDEGGKPVRAQVLDIAHRNGETALMLLVNVEVAHDIHWQGQCLRAVYTP